MFLSSETTLQVTAVGSLTAEKVWGIKVVWVVQIFLCFMLRCACNSAVEHKENLKMLYLSLRKLRRQMISFKPWEDGVRTQA